MSPFSNSNTNSKYNLESEIFMAIPVLPKFSKDATGKDKNLTARERELRANLPDNSPLPRLLPWIIAGLALLIGFGGGILVTRHRHESAQNVAAVNGTKITSDQLYSRLQALAGPATLHQIVQEQLQLQFAAKKGVAPTNADVEDRFQKMHTNPNFTRELAASGMSESQYKDNLRVKLAQAAVLTQGITASDAEIHKYYENETDPHNLHALFYQPETLIVRAIGVSSQATLVKAQQDLASHTPFEQVAAQYSQDAGSKDKGGLLQPLQRGRSPLTQTPALEQALFELKIGDQLGPVSFHNGWWLFRCEDKKLAQTKTFSEVKDDCILGEKIAKGTRLKGQAVQTEFQDFQHSSVLQAFWPQYQGVMSVH